MCIDLRDAPCANARSLLKLSSVVSKTGLTPPRFFSNTHLLNNRPQTDKPTKHLCANAPIKPSGENQKRHMQYLYETYANHTALSAIQTRTHSCT